MRTKSLCLLSIFWLLLSGKADATGYTLTINIQGSGSVARNPTNSVYPSGAVVTLTATPATNWFFSEWSGDASGMSNPLNVTMDANKVITATFLQLPTYTLSLTTNGQGTISLNPAGGAYVSNTVVTATATPAAGWVFVSWSGSVSGTSNVLSVAMDTNVSLTGRFAQLPAFDVQPHNITNAIGSSVGFSGHSVGDPPLTYQWFFANGPLHGAASATLTLTNAQLTNAGNYWIQVSNNYGAATSSVVVLVLTNSIGPSNVLSVCDEPSLRAAIKIGGWIGINCNGTVALTNTINVTNSVILDAHSVSFTISGNNAVRIFYVAPSASLSATNLTLANGSCAVTSGPDGVEASAGAIYNDGGAVSLVSCALTNNIAESLRGGGVSRGGAIFNSGGAVSLYGSSISNNAAIAGTNVYEMQQPGGQVYGGAICSANGSVVIVNCSISSNFCTAFGGPSAACYGGALFQASGSLLITKRTFSYNLALGGVNPDGVNGTVSAYGGGLASASGIAVIDHCLLEENIARGGDAGFDTRAGDAFGGAVYSASTLTIESSTLSGNEALAGDRTYDGGIGIPGKDGHGGGLYNAGTAILNRCSFYSNYVQGGSSVPYNVDTSTGGNGLGGGIFNASQLRATNCTLALNTTASGVGQSLYPQGLNGNALGGGVYNDSGATFVAMNITVASNFCNLQTSGTNGLAAGAQVANTNGTLRLHNSILAYGDTNGNAWGVITDEGFNMSSDGSANLFSGSSYNYTDPELGPLDYYTGPTLTMALLSDSPAIDFGDRSGAPPTDQRWYPRPNGDGVDIGAYEFYLPNQTVVPRLTITAAPGGPGLSYTAFPTNLYRVQISSNLVAWSDLETNGPFTSVTNLSRTFGTQGTDHRFFRLRVR